MPVLNFYASPTLGQYGIVPQANLPNGQTFGSWGATVCIILTLQMANGDLFCGHMACDRSGIPGNKATVTQQATALVTAALGAGNTNQAWTITSAFADITTTWMETGIRAYFAQNNNPVRVVANDAYFTNNGGAFNISQNSSITGGTTVVNSGPFTVL